MQHHIHPQLSHRGEPSFKEVHCGELSYKEIFLRHGGSGYQGGRRVTLTGEVSALAHVRELGMEDPQVMKTNLS
jgi:hypothetical protein